MIAHSLGSYMALTALESVKNSNRIIKVILLFPVLESVPGLVDVNKTLRLWTVEILSVCLRVFSPDVQDEIVCKLSRNMFSSYDCMNNIIPIFKEFINIGEPNGFRDIISKYEDKISFHLWC